MPERTPLGASDPELPLVEGAYMDRSVVDFQRSCLVHIAEEQRKPAPDTALIALLCDAIRCSRELTTAYRKLYV